MLTRNEAINEVLAVYDELDRMGEELNLYREREGEQLAKMVYSECGGDAPDPLTAKLLEFAVNAIVAKVCFGWKEVRAKRAEGEVVYSPSTFEQWLAAKTCRDNLPDWMSRDEFTMICGDKLREMYAGERKAAYEKLLEEEAEEDAGDESDD